MVVSIHQRISVTKNKETVLSHLACERRRISGCRLSPPKNNVCELEPENDYHDVKILSQSELGSENPRTATRVTCESIARLRGENNVGRSGHGARKVCEVFGFKKLNHHQIDALKYVVKKKEEVFVLSTTHLLGESLAATLSQQ